MKVEGAGLDQLIRIFRLVHLLRLGLGLKVGFRFRFRLRFSRLRFRLGGPIFGGFELGEFFSLGFGIRLLLRLRLCGPVGFVLRGPGWDEVDREGFCGVSLFLQACDGRVDDEDQGLVAKDGNEQQ